MHGDGYRGSGYSDSVEYTGSLPERRNPNQFQGSSAYSLSTGLASIALSFALLL